jgi:hypothetical protein
MKCALCTYEPAEKHHIFSRASYGRVKEGYDVKGNYIYLCRLHHTESHFVGQKTFFKNHGMEDKYLWAKDLRDMWNATHKKVKQIKQKE